MESKQHSHFDVSEELLEAIRTFAVRRDVEHCGVRMMVTPFDLYADCSQCGARIKVRSFSANGAIEDIFDAVFDWMNQPMAQDVARRRQMTLKNNNEMEPGEPGS